jgi:hypothetical protein
VAKQFSLFRYFAISPFLFSESPVGARPPQADKSVTRASSRLAYGELTINTSSISLSPKQLVIVNPNWHNFWPN